MTHSISLQITTTAPSPYTEIEEPSTPPPHPLSFEKEPLFLCCQTTPMDRLWWNLHESHEIEGCEEVLALKPLPETKSAVVFFYPLN